MGDIRNDLCEIHQIGRSTRELLIHPERCPAMCQHGIVLAGLSRARNQFRFVRHRPLSCQVLVSFRGSGRVLVDGAWKTCDPGHAYITPPGTRHAYHSRNRWEVGWVVLESTHTPPGLTQPVLREIDPRPLEQVLHGLCQETTAPSDPILLEHWTGLLHGYTRRILTVEKPARLWNLWNAVQRDPSHPWTLRELARHVHMNVEYLRRLCLQEVGCSPMKYVTRLRMHHAAALLGNGQKMEAIAQAVGYDNQFAFSVAFKRVIGRSPGALRDLV